MEVRIAARKVRKELRNSSRRSSLFACPLRLSLFEERGDTFAEVFGGANLRVGAHRSLDLAIEFFCAVAVQKLFGCDQRARAVLEQGFADLLYAGKQLIGRYDFCDHPEAECLFGAEDSSRQEQVARLLFT